MPKPPPRQGSNRTGVKAKPGAGKPGLKPRIMDWEKIGKMFSLGCTIGEVCNIEMLSDDWLRTLCERDNNCTLSDFVAKHRDKGKVSLRRAQYDSAVNRNSVPMQIWLGKNWLGQTDKIVHSTGDTKPLILAYGDPANENGDTGISKIGQPCDDSQGSDSDEGAP
jgi:hypothetical protein